MDRELRDDINIMIGEKVKNSENILILKMDNFEEKLDNMNTNLFNFLQSQDVIKNQIIELQKFHLTKEQDCPYRNEIKSTSEYIKQVRAVKKFTIKAVTFTGIIITIINGLLIYFI